MKSNAQRKTEIFVTQGFERICSHDISWHLKGEGVAPPEELDECSQEHIQNLLIQNCREGELFSYCNESEEAFYGWWSIQTGARI